MRGEERFSSQVRNLVTDLVVTRHDKDDPLTVKGMADRKGVVAAVTVMRDDWRL